MLTHQTRPGHTNGWTHRRHDGAGQSQYLVQQVTNEILDISLKQLSLEEMLGQVLDVLITLPWVPSQSQGVIFVIEDDPRTLVLKAQRGFASEHACTCNRIALGECFCGMVAQQKKPVFTACRDCQHVLGQGPCHAHANYCAPLLFNDTLVGILNLYLPPDYRPNPCDEIVFSTAASLLAEAIHRRQTEKSLWVTREQLAVARAIQQRLYPCRMPRLHGLDIAGASWPADVVGGDYFDFISNVDRDTDLLIAIGDASGHGLGPALVMAETRAALRCLCQERSSLFEIMQLTNRLLIEGMPDQHYATLMLVQINVDKGEVNYCNAGHPAGYVFGPDRKVRAELDSPGHPLGMFMAPEFSANQPVSLHPGDMLLLMTDGVFESANTSAQCFGIERVKAIVAEYYNQPAHKIVRKIYENVRDHCFPLPPMDDLTVVVAKVAPTWSPRSGGPDS